MKKAEISDYATALEFLYGLQIFGANFGLETPLRMAALLGNPQEQLRFIHVAGTNGKGSTCAMLESIYHAAGLRVGLFTSPHLVSFRERIQVNRQLIPESEIVRLVKAIRAANENNQVTLFEFATVMALKYFAEQKCDLVIWETGLGGRLDATNIVTPLASVITNIAFDHEQWLGNTLAKIATEKAGIIKPGVPVVTATAEAEALEIIQKTAHEKNAPLTLVAKNKIESQVAGTITSSMLGDHQKLNAALALATVAVLNDVITVNAEAIRVGLANVNWAGRLQLIQKPNGQKILLDGAHNLAGATALCAALKQDFPAVRPLIIFGALGDKNWSGICNLLAPLADKISTVPVASDRTTDPNALAEAFRSANPKAVVSVKTNLSEALKACKDEPFVVITGSLYLIGEALESLGISPTATDERGLNEWTASKKAR